MAGGRGKRVGEAVTTFFGATVFVAVALALGWIVGFRPIEWAFDIAKAANSTPSPVPAVVGERIPADEGRIDPPSPPQSDFWSCGWDPTMNDNWHDDVLCIRGFEFDRPLLLTDWEFVTYDDMMAAAVDYEAWLNSR